MEREICLIKDILCDMECIRVLKNNIQFLQDGSELKNILITSLNSGEGKTTVASSLTMSMAYSGKKTLLMDFNIFNPSVDRLFNTLNYVQINIDFDMNQYIRRTEFDNLYIFSMGLANTSIHRNRLINKASELLTYAKNNFDYTIIDMPSCHYLSFIQEIAQHVDGCIFVFKEGVSDLKEFVKARDSLELIKARIIGAVLNKDIEGKKLVQITSREENRRDNLEILKKRRRGRRDNCQRGELQP